MRTDNAYLAQLVLQLQGLELEQFSDNWHSFHDYSIEDRTEAAERAWELGLIARHLDPSLKMPWEDGKTAREIALEWWPDLEEGA